MTTVTFEQTPMRLVAILKGETEHTVRICDADGIFQVHLLHRGRYHGKGSFFTQEQATKYAVTTFLTK